MGAYRENLKYRVYNQYKVVYIPKSFSGGTPILPPLNVCFTRYLESCHHHPPSPFANILDLLQDRTILKQLPLALHYT